MISSHRHVISSEGGKTIIKMSIVIKTGMFDSSSRRLAATTREARGNWNAWITFLFALIIRDDAVMARVDIWNRKTPMIRKATKLSIPLPDFTDTPMIR